MCESGGSALRRVSWLWVLRQDLQNSSSVFLLNVVGSIGTCWPRWRWTRRTWCRQPSTSKRTADSVHGGGWTDTPGMGIRHYNVDELDTLEQRAELFRRQPKPPDGGKTHLSATIWSPIGSDKDKRSSPLLFAIASQASA